MGHRLLVKNLDWIITMDAQRKRYQQGHLTLDGNRIDYVGAAPQDPTQFDQVIDGTGMIMIPGMINVHHHCAHTLVRNLPNSFSRSLTHTLHTIYGQLAQFTPSTMKVAALGGLGDLLKTGCTTSCDHHYLYPQGQGDLLAEEIAVAQQLGIRFHGFRGSLSVGAEGGCDFIPPNLVETTDAIIRSTVDTIQTHHDATEGAMVRIGVAPCWLPYETQEVLRQSAQIANQYKVPLHSHLADSRDEFSFCKERFGCTPVEYAHQMGYLGEGNFFAHCVQMTKNDYALLAKTKTAVAHCPNSDMLLNTAIAKLPEFFRRGITVGIGVDGAASNNASNMIAELRNAFLIQKFHDKTHHIPAELFLEMVTVQGAKVLGRSDIGHLAAGMMGDFVLLDWSQFQYAGGMNDPISAIVLSGDARMVSAVFVNGKQVVRHGHLTQIDERQSAIFINQEAKRLQNL